MQGVKDRLPDFSWLRLYPSIMAVYIDRKRLYRDFLSGNPLALQY